MYVNSPLVGFFEAVSFRRLNNLCFSNPIKSADEV